MNDILTVSGNRIRSFTSGVIEMILHDRPFGVCKNLDRVIRALKCGVCTVATDSNSIANSSLGELSEAK